MVHKFQNNTHSDRILKKYWRWDYEKDQDTFKRKVVILLFPNIYVTTGTNLRRAATFAIDSNVRAAVTKLQDYKLSKLAYGDTYTLDAYYHPSCLAALYNWVRNIRPSKEQGESESSQVSLEAIALAELVMYIEEASRQWFSSCLIWQKCIRVYLSSSEGMFQAV